MLVAPDTLESFLERTEDLLEKAEQPGEALYVGLLGGTGVGKSTLINGLARQEISHPSDRRPFTDRAVVYRHEETPRGLEDLSHLVRESDAVHTIDAVKDLVLLDLPDFDSIESDNRSAVLEILPRLDCVIWVVSPEKYADAAFYDLIGQTLINRNNFTFVLNKADELNPGGNAEQRVRFKEVLGDLSFRLREEAGVEQPRIFYLSALQEFQGTGGDPVPAKEFTRFRDFLMVRRDAKEIASVKTVNLIEQTGRLLKELRQSIRPDERSRILEAIGETQLHGPSDDRIMGLGLMEHEQKLGTIVFKDLAGEDTSILPVRVAMKLIAMVRPAASKGPEESLETAFQHTAQALEQGVRDEIEKLGDRMDSELLLAFHRKGDAAAAGDTDQIIQQAERAAAGHLLHAADALRRSMSGGVSRLRRTWQRLVLFLPFLILALKLAGKGNVQAWLEMPSIRGALKLMLTFLMSLFGSEALAGITVLIIFQLLLIWFLASGRIRKLERQSRRLARSAVHLLETGLKSAAEQIRTDRLNTIERVQDGVNRLNQLTAAFDPSASQESAPELHANR